MLKKDIIVTSLENIEVLILYRSYRRAKNTEIKVMSDVFLWRNNGKLERQS